MRLRLVGTSSGKTGCPAVYTTDRDTFVIQGWKLEDTDRTDLVDVRHGEDALEIPLELADLLIAERSRDQS